MFPFSAPDDSVLTVQPASPDEVIPLTDLKLNETAVVQRVTAPEPCRSRLFSLGCLKGAHIKLKGYTLSRHTYKIEINGTNVGLRVEEARNIFVQRDNA